MEELEYKPQSVVSLPLWERGLKLMLSEIALEFLTSLPLWERGLKWHVHFTIRYNVPVAPLVGAWIEITNPGGGSAGSDVAPLVGAWIEI